jgi:ketosteroid isomerase-like protein
MVMRKTSMCLLAATFALSALPTAASECRTLESLDWLLGEWVADGAKSTFRESWTARGPQTWEGRGVETSKSDPAKSSGEELRLVEMAGGVYYLSKVTHNELPVAFRLTECADGRFVFVNAAHDFPKRLDYVREGEDRLKVRVSDGADKGFTLDFARMPVPAADLGAVLAAEDARFAAMVAADPEAMLRWFADDLLYVHSTGVVEDREQLIATITGRKLQYLAIEPSTRRVVFQGADAAFVHGIARIKARAGDKPLDFSARYLAVYALQDAAWRLRAWQSLRLP